MTNRLSINLSWWRFLWPFGLQLAVILLIPAKSAYTYNFGMDAVIQTTPVDPYDLLRGYSQTFRYDISNISDLRSLPGGNDLSKGNIFYLILEADSNSDKIPPSPGKLIKIASEMPANLPKNQVAIKGEIRNSSNINYGLERYYMPESQRNKINYEIRDLQRDSQGKQAFVVGIKVDRWGNSVPVSLWIGEKNYRF